MKNNKEMKIYGLILAAATITAFMACGDKHEHEHEEVHAGHDDDRDGHDDHGDNENREAHDGEIIFSAAQAKTAGLAVETAAPGSFHTVIHTSGKIQAALGDEETVAATAAGIISFPGKGIVEGTAVGKGTVIATISAKNIVDGDPAAKAKIAFEAARREYQRAKELVKDRIISAREFEQARAAYETAHAAYGAQAANMTAAGISVTTKIGGYIKNRLVSQGEYVSVGQPVATVSQNKRLQLRADVAESDYGKLRSVTDANFTVSYDKRVYRLDELKGKILSFGKTSDANSSYIPVTFEFDNVGNIIPGSYADVYLLGAEERNVISVPVSALTEEQGLYFVYLQTGREVFVKREVTTGTSNGERVKILSGLKPGDKVVVKGAYQVKLAANASVIPEGHSH